MGANDKNEATYHPRKRFRDAFEDAVGGPPVAPKQNIIEKLTAPPETLVQHMARIGLAWEELNGQIRFDITDMDIAEGRY